MKPLDNFDDRRRHQRTPQLLGATLRGEGASIPLFVIDVSAGGVHAAAHSPVALGSRWGLSFNADGGGTSLTTEARVVWVRETSLSGSFHFGLEFQEEQAPETTEAMLAGHGPSPLPLSSDASLQGLSESELQRLGTLGQICRLLQRSPAALLPHQLTQLLCQTFAAERAMVLLRQDDGVSVVSLNGSAEGAQEARYSDSVTDKVLSRGEPLLSLDARGDKQLGPSQSISLLGTRAVMAVPLSDGERVFGLVYMDNSDIASAFSHADLEMVTIMADIAAAAIERAELDAIMRENEAELIQARRAAEAADLAKTQFLANVSHEIRTPMNGVLGMTRQMMATELDDEQEHCLSIVASSAEHLLEIINDLLDFTRLGAGELQLCPRDFSLPELLEGCLGRAADRLSSEEVQATLHLDLGLPLLLHGDDQRLQQVLLKLLDNAVKFTQQGRVELWVEPSQGGVRFAVRDTGPGLSSEQVARVMQPFSQGDSSSTRDYGGLGMGLALCHGLVTLMGGTLEVESVPGQGSEFAFTLELPQATESEVDGRSYRPEEIPPLSILLVEDNMINQMVAEGMLTDWGHVVAMADNGQIALDMLDEEHPYDLIFMDLQMPVMDGIEATREIRAREGGWSRPRVPIVALTAHGTGADRRSCQEAGMDDFLNKPMIGEEILSCLGRLFASSDSR